MSGNWIAVACADRVKRGSDLGIMQVGHGKTAPLRRIRPGDRVVYYSPTTALGGKDKLQSFTAIGIVREGEAYQADMGGGFHPFRRDIDYLASRPAPIRPLLGAKGFALAEKDWGGKLRFGLVAIDDASMRMIAKAMNASLPA
jgi:hypothetical protein